MEELKLRATDGTELRGYRWEPEGEAKADLLLVHGLGEHLGRYVHVAAALTAAGYRVTGVELRGHGHSEGKRGHILSWEDYVDDLRTAAAEIGGPYAIVAHSMGGLVTLDHLRDASAWAAFTSAPPLGFSVEVPAWKTAASGFLSKWLPRVSLSNEIDPNDVCSDPAVVKAYTSDPLVFSTVTPRWFTEFVATIARVNGMAGSYDTPLFVAWGAGDKISAVDDIQAFCDRYAGPVETRAYPDMFHEIFNEKGQDEVLGDVVTWLDARLAESSATS